MTLDQRARRRLPATGGLSQDELVDMVLLMFFAGHQSIVNVIVNASHALLTHPEQRELVCSGQEPWSAVVEETMRWNGAVNQFPMRYPLEDIEVGGEVIRRGEAILASFGSASSPRSGSARRGRRRVRHPPSAERPSRLRTRRALLRRRAPGALATGDGAVRVLYPLSERRARGTRIAAASSVLRQQQSRPAPRASRAPRKAGHHDHLYWRCWACLRGAGRRTLLTVPRFGPVAMDRPERGDWRRYLNELAPDAEARRGLDRRRGRAGRRNQLPYGQRCASTGPGCTSSIRTPARPYPDGSRRWMWRRSSNPGRWRQTASPPRSNSPCGRTDP